MCVDQGRREFTDCILPHSLYWIGVALSNHYTAKPRKKGWMKIRFSYSCFCFLMHDVFGFHWFNSILFIPFTINLFKIWPKKMLTYLCDRQSVCRYRYTYCKRRFIWIDLHLYSTAYLDERLFTWGLYTLCGVHWCSVPLGTLGVGSAGRREVYTSHIVNVVLIPAERHQYSHTVSWCGFVPKKEYI